MVLPKKIVYSEDTPLYKQISSLLAKELHCRHTPGDTLPSENELAKRYQVNRHTLRRALEELVNEGIVGKLQGRGTIVQQKLIDYSINSSTQFTETLERNGRKAESIVLRKLGIPAQGEIAELLKIEEDEPVALVETLRKMDGIPFSVVSHYLPLEKVFDVIRIYRGGSLHRFLLEHYGIRVKRTLSMIRAVLPEQHDRKLLGILNNSPIIRIKSINVDQQTDQPMELAVSRFKGTSAQIIVEPR
jgi:GntR family phosphonate transport system transcriptional regulator